MTDYLTATDIVQIVALCAFVFIPLGYFLMPLLGRLALHLDWRFGGSRYFRRHGSLARYVGSLPAADKQGKGS